MKLKPVRFTFDPRNFESAEHVRARNPDGYDEVLVRNAKTGVERVLLIPKLPSRHCPTCRCNG